MDSIYSFGKILFFCADINNKNINRAIKILKHNDRIDRINLTTYGGDIDSGLRFISFINENKTNIHIHVDGYAMSMGTVILGSSIKRTMGKYSMLMYHDVCTTLDGDYTTSKLKDQIYYNKVRISLIHKIINPNNNKDLKKFLDKSLNSRRDTYITSSKALSLGIIDEII